MVKLALILLLAGCPDPAPPDFDGDGVIDAEDCAPDDRSVYPGAPDLYGDGIDQDCEGCGEGAGDGVDADCDGAPRAGPGTTPDVEDCNDNDPAVHPGADDPAGDDLDADCDGLDGTVGLTLSLSPDGPTTLDDLHLTVEAAIEVEGFAIAWFRDDEELPDLADLETVPSDRTAKGQIWAVEVQPILLGQPLAASRRQATTVIVNHPAGLDAVELSPAAPSEGVAATATLVGLSDPDPLDQPFARYRWFVDGVEVLGWGIGRIKLTETG